MQCLHACVYVIQPRNFTGWDSEGVKGTSSLTKFSFGSFLPAGDRPDFVVVVEKTRYEKVN